jgi:signal transduction histidine kinase
MELDSLKKTIRQSTYYDSSAVFLNGQKAIRIAQKLNDPDEEALIYQYYGNFYYFSSNFDRSREYYARSIEIAQKNNNKQLINSTKIRLAFMLSETDLLAGEKEFKILLNEALKNDYVENTTEIYNGLGNIYDTRQMKDESLKFYLKGLRMAERSGNKYHQAMILNNIGLIKFGNEQVEEAEKDFKEGLVKIIGLDEDRLALNLNNNLGLVNKEQGQFVESIKYYHNTVKNAKKLGFPMGIGVAYLNLGDSYMRAKNLKKAANYSDSSIYILKNFKAWDYLGMAYLIKSNIYRDRGDLKRSKYYIDSVFNLHKQYPNVSNIMNAHRELSLIYEKEGKFKDALFHSRRYHAMNDSLSEIANKDQLAQLQVLYGKEKVETELESEKNKNSLLSKENELKQTRIQVIVIVSILLLIIGIGFVYIRHIRLTRKQQKDFTQKLIENIDDERSRISRDLHDDIGQSLSVIKSKINLYNSGKTHSLEGLETDVGYVIDQTRNISHFLHPSFVAKLGLERSLVSLTEKTQNNTGIVCSLSIRAEVENMPLEYKTQIYRILQECINNTIKHANATALKISIKENSSGIEIEYRDNGSGISDQNIREGIGLMTIRERADKINARVSVTSSAGKGYKLQLSMSKPEFA